MAWTWQDSDSGDSPGDHAGQQGHPTPAWSGFGSPGLLLPPTATMTVPATTASIPRVRAWTCEQATSRGWQTMCDVIELLISELATNAIRHTSSAQIVIRVQATEVFEAAVYDTSTHPPDPRQAMLWDEGGRGLALVHKLAGSWGTRLTPDGKWVWFRLRPRPR